MRDPASRTAPFVVGWEEWLALPDLGLPAIRAKIDTGAKTSALHAFAIDTFGPASAPMVRFGVHPIPGREDIARYCTAPIVDRREVTSSNGDREFRFVIRTRLVLGCRDWGEIEATLTNRESMAYRMLLGRQALRDGVLVDPSASFVQPKLSHRLYADLPKQIAPSRRLRIALVASKPARRSNVLLKSEAEARGHTLDILPLGALSLDYTAKASHLLNGGAIVGHFDAVIARASGGPAGLAAAVVRHLQRTGAVALNHADALDRLHNPYMLAEALQRNGIAGTRLEVDAPRRRILVILGEAAAAEDKAGIAAKRLAERVAAALGLGIVAVEVGRRDGQPAIGAIDANPPLTGFNRATALARTIITALETRVRMPAVVPAASEADA